MSYELASISPGPHHPHYILTTTPTMYTTTWPNNTITTNSTAITPYFPDGYVSDQILNQTAIWIVKIVYPMLVVLGTFGNTMVLVVLRRGAVSTGNLALYLSVLAVVDTIPLYTSCLQSWLRLVADIYLLHLGTWSCKLILFLSQTCQCLSAWLVVLVTWQRWYACAQPFQRCCPIESPKWGYAGVAILVTVLVGANSYVLITVKLHKDDWGHYCAVPEEIEATIAKVFPLLLTVLYSGVPAVLLFILNGLLVHVLCRSRRALLTSEQASRATGRGEVTSRYNRVTWTLLVLSLSWFLLAMPQTVIKHVQTHPHTARQAAINRLTNVLAYVALFLNHAWNFFIYCILIRSFRREAKRTAIKALTWFSSSVPHSLHCSGTAQDSVTDMALNQGHHHNHYNQHQRYHNHNHNHYNHTQPHHHDNPQHNQAESDRPLIIKFNNSNRQDRHGVSPPF